MQDIIIDSTGAARADRDHQGSSDRWVSSQWAADETEEIASELLHQTVRVLNPIPEDKRADLAWLS